MEVDSSMDNAEGRAGNTSVAIHPLAIVHMSDQYTRITSGGSPLEKNAPVVGLLFGLPSKPEEEHRSSRTAVASSAAPALNPNTKTEALVKVLDADDIPVEVSNASKLQVGLHTTVFPQHKVVGWYRVVAAQDENEETTTTTMEPTPEDLTITKSLQEQYTTSPTDFFCFCLLKVQTAAATTTTANKKDVPDDDEMKTEESTGNNNNNNTLSKELPINLYQLKDYEGTWILLGIDDWQLETSPAERLSVERVMKEKPSGFGSGGLDNNSSSSSSNKNNNYVLETQAMQHSLVSMKDRVQVLVNYLLEVQEGKLVADPSVLRQIQQIVASLGPLSSLAEATESGQEEEEKDVELLAHLAIVARTVNTIQSYTEKFRILNDSRNSGGGSSSAAASSIWEQQQQRQQQQQRTGGPYF